MKGGLRIKSTYERCNFKTKSKVNCGINSLRTMGLLLEKYLQLELRCSKSHDKSFCFDGDGVTMTTIVDVLKKENMISKDEIIKFRRIFTDGNSLQKIQEYYTEIQKDERKLSDYDCLLLLLERVPSTSGDTRGHATCLTSLDNKPYIVDQQAPNIFTPLNEYFEPIDGITKCITVVENKTYFEKNFQDTTHDDVEDDPLKTRSRSYSGDVTLTENDMREILNNYIINYQDNKHIDIITHLDSIFRKIEHPENINKLIHGGINPLVIASVHGYDKIVKYLLDKGVEKQDLIPPLFIAINLDHFEVVKLLVERDRAIVNEETTLDGFQQQTPLMLATQKGNLQIVKLLLENGASVDKQEEVLTPLMFASNRGDLEIVKLLLENGANVDKESNGFTALFFASQNGHLEIVKLLLENGASVDKNRSMTTPLINASRIGHLEIVKVLLEHGASLSDKDNFGMTPLIAAVDEGNIEIVEYLLEKGANVHDTLNDGRTVIKVATSNFASTGDKKIMQLLLKYVKEGKGKEGGGKRKRVSRKNKNL